MNDDTESVAVKFWVWTLITFIAGWLGGALTTALIIFTATN